MPNNNNDRIQCEEEIVGLANDLKLTMSVLISEDELAAIPADRIVFGAERYFVHVYWKLEGLLARHFCGSWKVKIDLESIGTAREYTSDVKTVPMEPCKEDEYHRVFTVMASDLDPHPAGTVYLPAVTLATEDPCGDPGHMWGYCEGPSVMFIDVVPHVPPGP